MILVYLWLVAAVGCGAPNPISSDRALAHAYQVRDPQFRRTMDSMFGKPALGGNSLQLLVDARESFPAMLESIRAAERSIALEIHTLWSGEVGDQFINALCERAQSGVTTHVIYDDAGSSRLKKEDVEALADAGVHLVRYNPVEKVMFIFTAPEVNHRTHRKLLVVDGRVGFIGGIGIADLWLGDEKHGPWRDTMYRVEGPVVAHLQGAFMNSWISATKVLCHDQSYFPSLKGVGELTCQLVPSSPPDGHATMELMFLYAMSCAEQSIDIATAYFVPDELLIEAMCGARQRGVTVRIVVPGPHTDQELVREASQERWDELLKAGVEIYEYQPSMYHCKFMIIDGFWTSVGSSNLDPRSLRLSEEANLNVYDEAFAGQHTAMLERDIAQSKLITELKHERRGILDRVGEFFASLWSPQL